MTESEIQTTQCPVVLFVKSGKPVKGGFLRKIAWADTRVDAEGKEDVVKSQVPTTEVMKGTRALLQPWTPPEDTVCEGSLRAVDTSEGSLVEGVGAPVEVLRGLPVLEMASRRRFSQSWDKAGGRWEGNNVILKTALSHVG